MKNIILIIISNIIIISTCCSILLVFASTKDTNNDVNIFPINTWLKPNIYYGTKTESSIPLTTGLMWFTGDKIDFLRHDARQEDRLKRWGWIEHNGNDYGKEKLIDDKNNIKLEISHIKNDMTIINVTSKNKKKLEENCTIIFYVWDESNSGKLSVNTKGGDNTTYINGEHGEHGKYRFKLFHHLLSPSSLEKKKEANTFYEGRYVKSTSDLWKLKDDWVRPSLRNNYMEQQETLNKSNKRKKNKKKKKKKKNKMKKYPNVIPKLSNHIYSFGGNNVEKTNIIAVQKVITTPFILNIQTIYNSENGEDNSDDEMNMENNDVAKSRMLGKFESYSNQFSQTFQKIFNFNNEYTNNIKYTNFAKAAFSNLIGSVTHFHGSSLIKHPRDDEETTLSKEGPLITGVPSRSFFPRGFLWDEGFHQLLIVEWDPILTMKVLKHWFHRMDDKGWIPREQILGDEALSKVPKQFQIQSPDVANPPALLLSIERLVEIADSSMNKKMTKMEKEIHSDGMDDNINNIVENTLYDNVYEFLNDMKPYLIKWYKWLKSTQSGPSYGTFRWRGRTKTHTLSSGLDDYPRGMYPSDDDKHVDLLSWMAYSAGTLKRLFELLNKYDGSMEDSNTEEHEENLKYIELYKNDNELYLKNLQQHWDIDTNLFYDIGVNDLIYDENTGRPISYDEPKLVKHYGYVSIFPLALRLLEATDERLGFLIDNIRDENLGLWSKYGLRSLSKNDNLFGKEENYWRGKIWININFLTLKALHKYSMMKGPYQTKAKLVYDELRTNVINNIYQQYRKGGFIYENYNSENGRGAGCHPFTGWSSLVVLIMGERY